jgi:hypothetical protein
MARRDTRKIGKLGEKALDSWATQADITINKADEDDQGWDFILEFPLPTSRTSGRATSLDLRPFPLKCFIQVKSSDDRPSTWSPKLDNWERLVKNPLPAFFLGCEFDGQEECQRAYLVHIDEAYIRKVLKRLREASAEGVDDVHKSEMVFRYDESHRLPSLDGFGLAQAIRSHITPNLETYTAAKMEFVRTAGYETDGFRVTLTVQLPDIYSHDPVEFIVDAALGIIPEIGPSRIEISDQRFGIEVPGLNEVIEDGTLEFGDLKPAAKAVICFSLPTQVRDLRIAADVYLPQGLGFELDEEHLKTRFCAPFIELVARRHEKTSRLSYSLPTDKVRYSLKNLRQVAELIQLFEEGIQTNSSLTYEILLGSRQWIQGRIDLGAESITFSKDVLDCAKTVTNAWTIAKYVDIQDTIEVSTTELLNQIPWIEFLAATIERKQGLMRLEYSLGADESAEMGKMCCPMVATVVLGDKKVLFGLAVIGVPTTTSSDIQSGLARYALVTDSAQLHGARAVLREVDSKEISKSIHNQIVKIYELEYDILTIAEFHNYL